MYDILFFNLLLILCIGLFPLQASKSDKLFAGTSISNITPDKPIQMAAYNRKVPSKGVHDSLYVRVLILEAEGTRLAIISCDLIGYMNNSIIEIAKKRFDIPHVLISSVHTHSGPDLSSSESYALIIEQKIIEGIEQAVNNLFPARITAGYRSFPQLGYNRLIMRKDGRAHAPWYPNDELVPPHNPDRIPFGPVDPEVGVIRIDDDNGRTRAVIMNYACHAVANAPNYKISADYPGVAVKLVEEAYGGSIMAMFVNGASGNIAPLFKSPASNPEGNPPTDYSQIEKMGGILADNVLTLTKDFDFPENEIASLKVIHDSISFSGRFNNDLNYNLHFVTILVNNKIAIATFPGEPFVKFQLFWKENAEITCPVF